MKETPTRLIFDLGGEIRTSPPMYFDASIKANPDDLTQFTPEGCGIYGFQNRDLVDPFSLAPEQQAEGGIIFFDDGISRPDFDAIMRVTRVHRQGVLGAKEFYAISTSSDSPGKEGYLTQMRIVSKFGLRFLFKTIDQAAYGQFPEQDLAMHDALWAFVEQERRRWNEPGKCYSSKLAGKFGGDGDYMRENLCFGFMVENSYHQVYRIWSRAWLVTK